MPKLDDAALRAALEALPGWSVDGAVMVRTYRRRDWMDAIALLNAVAEEAQRRDHHPDVCIERYRNITFRLTSHDSGGVTRRDIGLATWIDGVAAAEPDAKD